MSSTENSQDSLSEGLQIPGLIENQEPVEQLSFAPNPATPLPTSSTHQAGPQSSPGFADLDTVKRPISQAGPQSSPGFADLNTTQRPISQAGMVNPITPSPSFEPGSTRALLLQSQPAVTRALTDALAQPTTNSPRLPLVIRGDSHVKKGFQRPPQGRRPIISLAALLLLLIITGGTLLAASPLGREAGLAFSAKFSNTLFSNPNNNSYSLVVQATATAVYHQRNDGYDPNAGNGPVVTGSPHPWPVGVCTYWANARYHTLTGNWVTWTGNAYQWTQGARLAGWNVSSQPHVPSIIVLSPGAQGSSGYGHVAVVESINANGSAHTSDMNWYTNGGGWNRVSYVDFTAGNGVSFIWK
ncbi:MAG: CHAP domain-containing protein [Ktedonobacteraceae bacterium]